MIVDQVNLVVVVTAILAENALSLVSGNHVNIARIARPESLAVGGTEILRNALSLVSGNHVNIPWIARPESLAVAGTEILRNAVSLVSGNHVNIPGIAGPVSFAVVVMKILRSALHRALENHAKLLEIADAMSTVALTKNAHAAVLDNCALLKAIARQARHVAALLEIPINIAQHHVLENHVKILRAIVQRMKLAADRMRILAKHVLDLVLGRRVARIRTARQVKSVVMVNVLQNVPFVFRTVTAVKARGVVV